MIEPLDCECTATAAAAAETGGGRMPAAQENCEIHLLTTSATGETSLGEGITGSYQSYIKHRYPLSMNIYYLTFWAYNRDSCNHT